MNGDTLPDEFWERLDAKFQKVYDKIDAANSAVNNIKALGCAQRPNDLKRIDDLEGWRTKGIIGVISAMFTALVALVVAFAQGK